MKGTVKFLVIAFALVALVLVVAAMRDISSTTTASAAKPQGCPKGQEKQSGCKYVRHMVTGDCGWLPDQAVASPWEEVPEGSCNKAPTATSAPKPIVPVVPVPTKTIAPGEPKDPASTKDTFRSGPVCTPTLGECDPCLAIKALETIAAAQATQVAP